MRCVGAKLERAFRRKTLVSLHQNLLRPESFMSQLRFPFGRGVHWRPERSDSMDVRCPEDHLGRFSVKARLAYLQT